MTTAVLPLLLLAAPPNVPLLGDMITASIKNDLTESSESLSVIEILTHFLSHLRLPAGNTSVVESGV